MSSVVKTPIQYNRKRFANEKLLALYKALLKPRMVEDKMLILLRQGKISKWFSGIGQEAISVGCAMAMKEGEYILPMHRNLGVFTSRNVPLNRLFSQFQGKASGFTNGRDRSFHFGTQEYKLVGMISHLGPQMGVADGIALANKLKGDKKATLVFTGDGGTSEGDFHEALNVAAVWDLPVLFVVENNGWGLSTPSEQQFKCKQFIDKGIGYGMDAMKVDGNNILEVYSAIEELSESIRNKPRPILVECVSFRIRGHEEASGTKYYPEGIIDEWEIKDPVTNFEQFLLNEKIIDQDFINAVKNDIKKEIEEALEAAYTEKPIIADTEKELKDVYAPFAFQITKPNSETKTEKRLVDAISDGLKQAMQKHDNLVLMGQDIGRYGGVFKVTDGFVDEFGEERVRNTPLCESAILGAALGLSINGYKAMMEMQFADFVSEGITQIVNNLAKIHWRWKQNADVVIRMPSGAGVEAGPFHSQSNEAWFTHTPGLKVVYPAFPADAKGLLLAAFEDPNPVMFFEHKALYRSLSGDVPDDYYTLEIGKAKLVQDGNDLSIITYGMGVHWALEAVKEMNLNSDILDLRTLSPLDTEAIYTSAKKTGRVLVLHEDVLTGGIGGEIAALVNENCFDFLDAPVMRCGSLDTPVPFAGDLERNFLANKQLQKKLHQLLSF